mmetsp:Transcript_53979/g.127469  ORF Transcript_53979/g.127469 Transcript_53979/m.127469 type:complete len:202 (+) Transcript_53979:694-1299(+)
MSSWKLTTPSLFASKHRKRDSGVKAEDAGDSRRAFKTRVNESRSRPPGEELLANASSNCSRIRARSERRNTVVRDNCSRSRMTSVCFSSRSTLASAAAVASTSWTSLMDPRVAMASCTTTSPSNIICALVLMAVMHSRLVPAPRASVSVCINNPAASRIRLVPPRANTTSNTRTQQSEGETNTISDISQLVTSKGNCKPMS